MIDALVLDGTVTVIALAILALEIVVLLWWAEAANARRLVLANGLSGIFLILALRSSLLSHEPRTIALWLSLGFLAHLADLIIHLRR